MHLSEMCTNQPILTLGRKACGCHCSIGDWASENCDGAHFSPFTKEIRLRRKKGKSIIRKPCASSTVSKLSSLETRQVTKPGQPTTATASLRSARPEEQRMRSALSRVVPRLQGGEPRRRTRRLPRRPAQLVWLLSCPSPAPLGHSQPGAPPRTGTRDAVTPSCAGASRDRAALRVRVSDRDPGAPRPLPTVCGKAGCGAVPEDLGFLPAAAGAAPGPLIWAAQWLWGCPFLVARWLGC